MSSEEEGSHSQKNEVTTRVITMPETPLPTDEFADAIVVGAGIAGSAMAHALGRQRRRVIALERDLSEPNRIVGELLQPGGVETLAALGLEECVEDIDAQAIQGYVVIRGEEQLSLTYPNAVLGNSFHHGRFVQRLRSAAALSSDLRGGTAVALLEDAKTGDVIGVEWRPSKAKNPFQNSSATPSSSDNHNNANPSLHAAAAAAAAPSTTRRVFAPLTIIADGCFSRFRKAVVQGAPEGKSHFVGLLLHGVALPQPNRGHVVLADPAPVLMYPISSTEVRVLVDVPSPLPSAKSGALAQYLQEVVAPQLPPSLRAAFAEAVRAQRLRSMPNNRLHPEQQVRRGLVVVGDALNMRHPLTGGGMTVALNDVRLIAQGLQRIRDWRDVEQVAAMCARFHAQRYPRSATINVLAQALYEVFSATADPALPDMRDACFNYFKLGGLAVSGPMGLLAGLTESPKTLVTHFFAAALYGASQQLFPLPLPWKIPRAYRLVRAATNLVQPLLEKEGVMPSSPLVHQILSKL